MQYCETQLALFHRSPCNGYFKYFSYIFLINCNDYVYINRAFAKSIWRPWWSDTQSFEKRRIPETSVRVTGLS